MWMAPDQDLVTGDLKESSSMTVLFLRSSGAAFAFWSGLWLWLTGWLDLTPLAGALVHRKSYRRVAKLIKVMGLWAHGDVDTLGIISCSLHGQQCGGTWIHGQVVVFGIGAIQSAYKCLPQQQRTDSISHGLCRPACTLSTTLGILVGLIGRRLVKLAVVHCREGIASGDGGSGGD